MVRMLTVGWLREKEIVPDRDRLVGVRCFKVASLMRWVPHSTEIGCPGSDRTVQF